MAALRWQLEDAVDWLTVSRTQMGDYRLIFGGSIEFEISADGSRIDKPSAIGVSQETVDTLYFNQVLPLALSRQGALVLHASCVEIDDFAVAFVGKSGLGKSTLAASFASNGQRFLTDDGLHVEQRDGEYLVKPSRASIRLWDDSSEALLHDSTVKAPATDYTSKSRFLADQVLMFCDEPRRLRCAYFLGDGSVDLPTIGKIAPAEAMVELVRHAFLLEIEEREALSRQFAQLTNFVNTVKMYRLDYERNFTTLCDVRAAVLAHASATTRCE